MLVTEIAHKVSRAWAGMIEDLLNAHLGHLDHVERTIAQRDQIERVHCRVCDTIDAVGVETRTGPGKSLVITVKRWREHP